MINVYLVPIPLLLSWISPHSVHGYHSVSACLKSVFKVVTMCQPSWRRCSRLHHFSRSGCVPAFFFLFLFCVWFSSSCMVLLKHSHLWKIPLLPSSLPKVLSECAIAFGKVFLDSIKQTLPDTGCPFCNVRNLLYLNLYWALCAVLFVFVWFCFCKCYWYYMMCIILEFKCEYQLLW